MQTGNRDVHPHPYDALTLPLLTVNLGAWATGWLMWFWQNLPGPTGVYMLISALFMLFQMADKLGLLRRFKRGDLDDTP